MNKMTNANWPNHGLSFLWAISLFLLLPAFGDGQTIDDQLKHYETEVSDLDSRKVAVSKEIEALKFAKIQRDLEEIGQPALQPGDQLVVHSAYRMAYCEAHEQPRWVAHIIPQEVKNGVVLRTNDFRPDTLVKTGSAVEADYFLKKMRPDSTFEYDAFGYDRGHLAPSADFRWSATALSESYFYSNMSPQLAEFNRGGWGELEDRIRQYVFRNAGVQLYVVTGPVLKENLPVIERGVNKVSIPTQYWKVALDLVNGKGIGFLMPNRAISEPLESFAVPIDTIERLTGLDFFSNLPDELESNLESQCKPDEWIKAVASGDVEPFDPTKLPRNHFNTVQAMQYAGKTEPATICGTVVSARKSKKGNILLNLDKQFPNQIFTVFIRKENIANFSFDAEKSLKGKSICVTGKVVNLDGTAAVFIENESELKLFEGK